jgi:hypothetical protein
MDSRRLDLCLGELDFDEEEALRGLESLCLAPPSGKCRDVLAELIPSEVRDVSICDSRRAVEWDVTVSSEYVRL